MSFLDEIGSMLNQYRSGTAPDHDQARVHYDEIARAVPPDILASSIGTAVGELDSDHVERKIEQSATAMTPDQRGSFLQTILAGLGGGAAGAALPDLLRRIGASPSVATDPTLATPQDVAKVAKYAKDTRPEIFQKAMGFYAEHPMLVKVLGTLAIAAIAKNLAGGGRRG
ncbi:MAG: hypothetical protein ABI592_05850 [Acidobacteriota bacterium]